MTSVIAETHTSKKYEQAQKQFLEWLDSLECEPTPTGWDEGALPKVIPGVDVILMRLGGADKLGGVRFGFVTRYDGRNWKKGEIFNGHGPDDKKAMRKAIETFIEYCWYRSRNR